MPDARCWYRSAFHYLTSTISFALLIAPSAHAGLYEEIHQQVLAETVTQQADQRVAEEIAELLFAEWKTDLADVSAASRQQPGELCGEKPGRREALSQTQCERLMRAIQTLLNDEQRVRRIGRDLLNITAGLELATSDIYGHPLSLPLDQASILNIWQAGAGGVRLAEGGILARTTGVDSAIVRPKLLAIATALNGLPEEQRIAAVQRYRHGARLIANERAPMFPAPPIPPGVGPGTEQQYLYRRWLILETALLELWDVLPKNPDDFTPPLAVGEIAYFRFPPQLLRETGFQNVLVWGQADGDAGHPYGDVGLAWEIPREPPQPSLMRDPNFPPPAGQNRAILGGRYPAAVDEGSLCTHPMARRGYLCRPIEVAAADRCPAPGGNADTIVLTTCRIGETRATIAGPDVCRDEEWTNTVFDPQTQCKVDITCLGAGQSCLPGIPASAVVGNKGADGTIGLCMTQNVEGPAAYLMYHELVHVYQACGHEPGWDPRAGQTRERQTTICCETEGEAYQAQCEMMDQDGLFTQLNGAPVMIEGVPLTPEVCTEVLTDYACGTQQRLNGCQVSRRYPANMADEIFDYFRTLNASNPAGVPVTCDDAVNEGDPRIDALVKAIESRRLFCAADVPTDGKFGASVEYKNRIGNNFCYAGQCAEEMFELQETAGRTAIGVGDQGSPWAPPLPLAQKGSIERAAAPTTTTIPAYNPALLVQEFDAALCKIVGLPPRTPPVQCMANENRRLTLPLMDYASTMGEFLRQQVPQQMLSSTTDRLASAFGRERGLLLLQSYMRERVRMLATSLSFAGTILEQLRSVNFPADLCPITTNP